MKRKTIRLVIADDHKMMREGLARVLSDYPEMKLVGTAGDGREALRLVSKETPDVVIMDIAMPHLNGIDATRRITTDFPKTKVVAISMHSDKQMAAQILRAGALAFLLKECAVNELADAIHSAVEGRIYLCEKMVGVMVDSYVVQSADRDASPRALTTREREVLQLLVEGTQIKVIAAELSVSTKTVESHKHRIMSKLNLYTIPELTKYAIRHGLTTLD